MNRLLSGRVECEGISAPGVVSNEVELLADAIVPVELRSTTQIHPRLLYLLK
ncbi:MAG: hypothetical protein IT266_00845 [Saprospiraceae bacterium]|nr:hypothetical protein [Saprospiraceae bacterium]